MRATTAGDGGEKWVGGSPATLCKLAAFVLRLRRGGLREEEARAH